MVLSEEGTRLVESLKSLGLTKYEALVYIALLRVMSATASEIHESSGVPRASVYPVLDQLKEKDLVSVSLSAPKRFAALPPSEAIAKLKARIEHDAAESLDALTAIHQKQTAPEEGCEELIWNLHGIGSIRKRLHDLIVLAKRDIRIIAHNRLFSAYIKEALNRNSGRIAIEIITPCFEGEISERVKITVKSHPGLPKDTSRVADILAGGICIVDGARVLVIVGSGEEDAVALYSESEGFVKFFTRYYDLINTWETEESGQVDNRYT